MSYKFYNLKLFFRNRPMSLLCNFENFYLMESRNNICESLTDIDAFGNTNLVSLYQLF